MTDDTWETVRRLRAWLDAHNETPPDVRTLLRVLKITEEAGEVAEALHGVLGANPRKGHSHTWEDVQAELCDVIVTAMVTLASVTPDPGDVFTRYLSRVARRSLGG